MSATEETIQTVGRRSGEFGDVDDFDSPAQELEIATNQEEHLSGARKAAILCVSLDDEAATTLLKHLEEDEVEAISREIAFLKDIKSGLANRVIEEFHGLLLARNYITTGGVEFAKRLLSKSFSTENARRLTDKMLFSLEAPASFDVLHKTDPQQLAKLFQSEHPQTTAVVLAHLDGPSAANVLQNLPESQRGDIALRLANLQTVSADVIKRVAQVLNQKLSTVGGMSRTSIGGARAVADICNRLDRDSMKAMLQYIEETDSNLALEIRNLTITFDDLLLVDDVGIREIMTRVDKKVLAMALKGTTEELQNRFFSNMSSRAVEMMKEEMDFMGQVKMKDVTTAQREIVSVLRELDEQGVISLNSGGDGDEYVS